MGQQQANTTNTRGTVIADLIRNLEGRMGNATLSNYWLRPWRKLVLALRQYPQGRVRVTTRQTNQSPSPLMETFAKLSGTAIVCSDSQSAKLDFPIDSRLRGNDGRFCKGLLDGRGIKGEGENDASHRPNSENHHSSNPYPHPKQHPYPYLSIFIHVNSPIIP